MKNTTVRKITGTAILLAIEVVLQIIGNFVAIGPVSINLSLIPIALAAILYGPLSGGFLGLINGVIVLFSTSTDSLFLSMAPGGTVAVCLVKCTVAGLLAGLVNMLLSKKSKVAGSITASLLVPIINTGIFAAGCFTVLKPALDQYSTVNNVNPVQVVFLVWIGINFLFEFGITALLSPTIHKIMKIVSRSDKHAL